MRRRSPLAIGWVLATIAGATAVGITTQRPGFVVITFIGGLWLPRLLGFGWGGHHHRPGGGPRHGCHAGEAVAPRSEETVTA
ncbi:MAG: hypothetical protein QOG45_1067 [Chloroflexota bacterium]|jgi:hypothetical protein|nr:hypothetical protein [Chloroflexota bacterium]